ncbi:ead/Ea22-like family protein [Escherichia coli]|uniref:ead/Ea22-like family protein n=1 Tax=Escherichia coli TaxID=562 RepID=UPI0018A17C02|nr:ead/Ea22-like family protein [Escherichia coli]EFN7674346.1 ead/Ea22-like family protein [Escherichia coli]EGY0127504.1 ead/Ea22-like family protein [Escherichia coli]EHL3384124.1 ead/Ea22-like family protein [Escherichia coli]HBE9076486.1 ead/Ea22-like family protein [Escherichia coli]HDV1218625.1 ead/Ea22-like family protein [Escherichia coli]
MSEINYQALRERYAPKPVPKCRICGDEMTVQRICGSHITYGCTGATCDDKDYYYAEGRSIADDHYRQSRVTVIDVSDPEVLALLDERETAKKRIAELEEIATDYALKFQKAQDALKHALLLHKNTAGGFTVFLPEISEYFIDGVFQHLRYERDIEKAVIRAGGAVRWHNKK